MFLFIHERFRRFHRRWQIQIHLMFLFIARGICRGRRGLSFKYISCSYLSYYAILKYILHNNSNTSHVLIYRETGPGEALFLIFKYISCSYLSELSRFRWKKSFQFKYISCSYLSFFASTITVPTDIQIHLMFLFIFPLSDRIAADQTFKYISCSYLS